MKNINVVGAIKILTLIGIAKIVSFFEKKPLNNPRIYYHNKISYTICPNGEKFDYKCEKCGSISGRCNIENEIF
jgi:hypothetical protein